MTNFTMLVSKRPRLLKQAFDSIGDISGMTLSIYGDDPAREVHLAVHEFMRNKEGIYTVVGKSAGTGAARNSVINAASYHRGDYLYLSDDDVYFKRPDWLAILVAAYEAAWDEGYRVLGAYNHPYNGPIDPTAEREKWPYGRPWVKAGNGFEVYPVYAVATQSMLMRWEVWDKYGPFCQTPVGAVCASEDIDFTNKIRADGYHLGVITPALLVNCGVTNSFGNKIPGWETVLAEAPAGVIVE